LNFPNVMKILLNYCKQDLNSFYLPIVRRRFNWDEKTESVESLQKKTSSHIAILQIFLSLVRILAPIFPIMAAEFHDILLQHPLQSQLSSPFEAVKDRKLFECFAGGFGS